jgi:capsular exopolysaccharide synthesis family protein
MNAQAGISPDRARARIEDQIGAGRPPASAIGQTMVRLGFIQPRDADAIENERRERGGVFGRTALKLGYVTQDQLEYALGVHIGFLHEMAQPPPVPEQIMVVRNPFSSEADEFRALRTRLTTGSDAENLRRLAVTGVGACASAQYAAVNLASSLAQLGKETLLIDADLRRPSLAEIFNMPPAPGLTDVVAGRASYEAARAGTIIRGLDLFPAGTSTPDSQRTLGDRGFLSLINRAEQEYDVVMMLTTPYGFAAECEFVWASSSSALIVAKKNETRHRDLESAKRSLRRIGVPVAGAVVVS